jgi:hypothetical protein
MIRPEYGLNSPFGFAARGWLRGMASLYLRILNRFDAKTGKQIYMTRIDPAATAFTTSPWAYNGKLFYLSEEGPTFVIAAGKEFRLLHVNELDDMARALPALAGERLLIRTEHRSTRSAAKGACSPVAVCRLHV